MRVDPIDNLCINKRCKAFAGKIFQAHNISCPVTVKRISLKRALYPWITKAILKCIARKHELQHLSKDVCRFSREFKMYRNSLSFSIYYAKKQ